MSSHPTPISAPYHTCQSSLIPPAFVCQNRWHSKLTCVNANVTLRRRKNTSILNKNYKNIRDLAPKLSIFYSCTTYSGKISVERNY